MQPSCPRRDVPLIKVSPQALIVSAALMAVCGPTLGATSAAESSEKPNSSRDMIADQDCTGPFSVGRAPTPDQLDRMLVSHAAWLEDGRPDNDLRRADLCEADLSQVDLSMGVSAEKAADIILGELLGIESDAKAEAKPKWSVVDLRYARLVRANMAGTNLSRRLLTGANMFGANLEKARLLLTDLKDADLRNANLRGATFEKADLTGAKLDGADLVGADFSDTRLPPIDLQNFDMTDVTFAGAAMPGANICDGDSRISVYRAALVGADLSSARMENCDLSGFHLIGTALANARLKEVNLADALLWNADLSQAELTNVNLAGADLKGADFTESMWRNVNLRGANLREVNFDNVFYDPEAGMLPDLESMRYAVNLHRLLYMDSPQSLVALRDGFFAAGMRAQEREVNYALHRARRIFDSGPLERAFNFVLFEVTVGYGLWPGRPLKIVGILMPIFAILYFFALRSRGPDGIWQVWDSGRLRQDLGFEGQRRLELSVLPAIRTAAYFSVLSAFHIGWRDLNVGSWIQRVQPREYVLGASGWVRSVAGVQSLISVYLLALWLISYFGRPFVA